MCKCNTCTCELIYSNETYEGYTKLQMSKSKRLQTLNDFLEYTSDDVNAMSQHAPNPIYLLVESFCPREKQD